MQQTRSGYHQYKTFVGNENIYDSSKKLIGWSSNYSNIFYKMSPQIETVYRYLKRYYSKEAKYLLATYPYHLEPSVGIIIRDNYDGSISLVSKTAHRIYFTDINYRWEFNTPSQKRFAISEILRFLDMYNSRTKK